MPPEDALSGLISKSGLKELAGEAYFERGVAYFRQGAVERLVSDGRRVTARVAGTELYTVKLWAEEDDLTWDCTCPLGQDGEFCKHLVATGLAWLGAGGEAARSSPEIDSVRRFLEASDRQTLVEILTECACEDEALMERLLLAAQRQGAADPAAIRETIRRTLAAGDFVDYHAMPRLVARAAAIPELLRGLSEQDAATAAELSADAMRRGLDLLGRSDDSDGRLGDLLSEITAVHHKTFGRSGLPPQALAANLFELQLADGYDFFSLEDYLPALGEAGCAAYRRIAAEAWKKVPPLAPGSRADRYEERRYQLTSIMETLARRDGDVDALVEILRRDLSDPHAYLEIAQALADAKRHDEALKWAEEGHARFARRPDPRLEDFVAAEYHRRGRHRDAIALRWSRFTATPSLHGYRQLKESADQARNWSAWRDKALAAARKAQRRRKPPVPGVPYWMPAGASLLVEIFLWEGDPTAALREARAGGCAAHLWLQLAGALELDHPDQAVAIYQERIDPIVNLANNQAYDRAADHLRRIRVLMARVGKTTGFGPYLDALRVRHKAKRNFIQRLEAVATEKMPALKSTDGKRK